jgi:ATP-binding cassette subfamily B protein
MSGLVLSTVIDVAQPFLWKQFINLLSASSSEVATGQLLLVVWYIFALALLNQGVWRAMGYVNNFFQPRVMTNLMNTCYAYLQDHSFNFFNNNFVGSIVTRVRRFQGSFEKITDQFFWNLSRTTLRILLILGVLFYLRPVLGVLSLVWSVVYLAFAYGFTRYKLPFDIQSAKQDTKVTAHLILTITNNMVKTLAENLIVSAEPRNSDFLSGFSMSSL